MFKLSEMFLGFFPVRFYDNDQGAAGGAVSPAPEGGAGGDSGATDLVGDDDIPAAALENDPELRAILEDEKKSGKDKKGSEDGDAGGDEVVPEDVDSGAEGDVEKKGGEADDTTGGTADDLSTVEFEDDVIPGLKAAHLKVMPKEALEALADFQGTHAELSAKVKKTGEDLTKLLADPIVKRRMDLLKSGKKDYEVRGINVTERQSILKAIAEEGDLDASEAEKIYSVLEKSLDTVVREAATDTLQGLIQEDSQQRQVEETQKAGRQLFLELGQFNKSLAFKETDVSKFWNDDGSINDKHAEAKLFREKILPLMAVLAEGGQSYDSLVKMSKKLGAKAVYALAAVHLGLPVAINTEERDKKIVASELKKKLAPFMKKNSVASLDTKGGSALPPDRSLNGPLIKNGYDCVKLAEGGPYYDKAVQTHPERLELIDKLAEEGASFSAKKQKVKQ